MGEKIVLNPGFAVWVSDVVMANACTSRLGGVRGRVNGEKANNTALILEEIERGGWFSIGFLDIEKVGSGYCVLDSPFEVGTVDPESSDER